MPQPSEVGDLSADLRAFYTTAWSRLQAEEAAVLSSWPALPRPARLRRLRALERTVAALMRSCDELAQRFAGEELPRAYALGVAHAGVGQSSFTAVDVDAVNVVARNTYSDLLAATAYVRSDTKALIRTLVREHLADKLIRGETAVQAGRDLAAALADRGIAAVTYANGARHGLADYADMAVRTTSAQAYNGGLLASLSGAGVGFVEVADGFGCGTASHDDPSKAAGAIWTLQEAAAYPIGHPRCARSFLPRPEITTAAAAARAEPLQTPGQLADQEQVAIVRDAASRRLSAGPGRVVAQRAARLAKRRERVAQPP